MKRCASRIEPRAGFTMIELVIAITLLGMLLSSVALVSGTSERAFRRGAATTALEIRATALTDALLRELEGATLASLTPDPLAGLGTSQLQFVQAVDFTGETLVTNSEVMLLVELEDGELQNDLDDDGDGLVDERQLVFVERVGLATERRRVLTRGVSELLEGELPNGVDDNGNGLVDEQGFVIERRGRALDVQVTLARTASDHKASIMRTVRTSIMLRN